MSEGQIEGSSCGGELTESCLFEIPNLDASKRYVFNVAILYHDGTPQLSLPPEQMLFDSKAQKRS